MKIARFTFSFLGNAIIDKGMKDLWDNYFKQVEECIHANIKAIKTEKSKLLNFLFVPVNSEIQSNSDYMDNGRYWTHYVHMDINVFLNWDEKRKREYVCEQFQSILIHPTITSIEPITLRKMQLAEIEKLLFSCRVKLLYKPPVEITNFIETRTFEFGAKNTHRVQFTYQKEKYDLSFSFKHPFDAGPRYVSIKDNILTVRFMANEVHIDLATGTYKENKIEGITSLDNIFMY